MGNVGSGDVVLIMGASGVGKTSISYRLARHFELGITEVDDFQQIVESVSDPEQYPVFHLFRRTPEVYFAMNEDERLAHAVAYANGMVAPLERVIVNHLIDGTGIVLDGDFIHPGLTDMARYPEAAGRGRVRALVLYEDEGQIAANYLTREGELQLERAGNSWRYGEWLRGEAERWGLMVIRARPWETVLERAIDALNRQ